MQIHILEESGRELAAIDNVVRPRELEIPRTSPAESMERLVLFAGWALDETTRDLNGPTGRRVDLTSSEFLRGAGEASRLHDGDKGSQNVDGNAAHEEPLG